MKRPILVGRPSTRAWRAVVRAAVEEARARGDRRVGTEHLLLGLLATPSAACAALGEAGLDLLRARRALADLDTEALASVGVDVSGADLAAPADRAHRGRLAFTPGAGAALRGAIDEARRGGDRRVGPEHLLLVLAAAGPPDMGAQLLARFGIDGTELRSRLMAPWRQAG